MPAYFINENSNALVPARSTEYYTIVLTPTEKIYVKRTPFDIIKDSCLRDLSTYEGKRDAIRHLTGFNNKLPVSISTILGIFAFPTTSPLNPDCVWLFHHRIKYIEDLSKNINNYRHRSAVHFKDGSVLPLNVSHYSLKTQLERTRYCAGLLDF